MFLFFRYKDPDDKALAKFIRQQFGYYPGTISFYRQAFIHKSSLRDDPDAHQLSNERLEFLGDAVLDAVVAGHLFKRFPNETEGFLTKLKSKIVKREMLNELGEKLCLDKQVKHTQFGMNNPRSLLGNAFEALIGAIYLDKGFHFAKKIILTKVFQPHIDLDALVHLETDFKSRIIIWSQREKKKLDFTLLAETNLGAEMLYEIELRIDEVAFSKAAARTKKEAEQTAARIAWSLMFSEE